MEVERLAELLAYILVGIGLAPVLSLAITPVFWLLRTIFYVPFIRKGLREKAEKKGHVVVATLQKKHTIRDHHTGYRALPTMKEMGTYTYQVNGKKYTYRHITANGLHDSLTLYYIKKPRKATVGGDLGTWEAPWLKFYLIISLLVVVITIIVGMIMG